MTNDLYFNLHNKDCIEVMEEMPDNSVDLVIIDPPYCNAIQQKWDRFSRYNTYKDFMADVFLNIERILKPTGSLYFFHNDFNIMSDLHQFIKTNTELELRSHIIWNKENFRPYLWKYKSDKLTLRSWFNTKEDVLFYTFKVYQPITEIKKDHKNTFEDCRQYAKEVQEFIGLNMAQIKKQIGHRKAEHFFSYNSEQWGMPTEKTYSQLIDIFNIDNMENFKTYEELNELYLFYKDKYKEEIDKINALKYTHNLDDNHNNVMTSKMKNNGKLHPTQKPIDILERFVLASSNPGDIVFDCFMGSGSTGVAAIKHDRNFIGVEKEEKYFNISKSRIDEEFKKK